MKKNLSKRFILFKNGTKVNSYLSFGRALVGIESFFNRGDVLPDDSFTILDSLINLIIYKK